MTRAGYDRQERAALVLRTAKTPPPQPSESELHIVALTLMEPADSPRARARLASLDKLASRREDALTEDYKEAARRYREMVAAAERRMIA